MKSPLLNAPAKVTDSRAKDYIAKHGRESWELDALEPRVLVDLVRRHIDERVDNAEWNEAVEHEDEGRERLTQYADTEDDRLEDEDS